MSRSTVTKKDIVEFVKRTITAVVTFVLLFFLIAFYAALILSLTNYLLGSFSEAVPLSISTEIIKVIIEVDGLLIGFSGFIFATFLSALNTRITDWEFEFVTKKRSKLIIQIKENYLRKLKSRRRFIIFSMALVITSLLLSIFGSVVSLSIIPIEQVEGGTELTRLLFINPMGYLMAGVTWLIFTLVIAGSLPAPEITEDQTGSKG